MVAQLLAKGGYSHAANLLQVPHPSPALLSWLNHEICGPPLDAPDLTSVHDELIFPKVDEDASELSPHHFSHHHYSNNHHHHYHLHSASEPSLHVHGQVMVQQHGHAYGSMRLMSVSSAMHAMSPLIAATPPHTRLSHGSLTASPTWLSRQPRRPQKRSAGTERSLGGHTPALASTVGHIGVQTSDKSMTALASSRFPLGGCRGATLLSTATTAQLHHHEGQRRASLSQPRPTQATPHVSIAQSQTAPSAQLPLSAQHLLQLPLDLFTCMPSPSVLPPGASHPQPSPAPPRHSPTHHASEGTLMLPQASFNGEHTFLTESLLDNISLPLDAFIGQSSTGVSDSAEPAPQMGSSFSATHAA
eukprot:m.123251 g.123251  ORF g.123251 m.123251 type:complete len:360 (+) comp14617_c5_seq1:339-1418(+)